ncbi:MAG: hypothetical protein VXZ82_22240 [Planctomycetota bacterium]|nr:hypothetical protein [Planctomycetota bacterium]
MSLRILFATVAAVCLSQASQSVLAQTTDDDTDINPRDVIRVAVDRLVELQSPDGAWPYEGVYRVRRQIPVGYRVGGTAIVCSALISASRDGDPRIHAAVQRGAELIMKELKNPLMKPSRTQQYDVRIWGHIYAIDFFCRLKCSEGYDELNQKTAPWIKEMVDAVVFQEIRGGGWNYANKRSHCCFVTAPAVQSLLLAKQVGEEVPLEVLERSATVLEASRQNEIVFPYSGTSKRGDTQAGSTARAPVSESTLLMLGRGNTDRIKDAIASFHEHWDELEKRRKKTGTHVRPHGIAPYYFYYGHRYAAQAIRMLPAEEQQAEFEKFLPVLLGTKDLDNTWNDRVFDRSKAYGTAMAVLALSRESVLLPEKISLSE